MIRSLGVEPSALLSHALTLDNYTVKHSLAFRARRSKPPALWRRWAAGGDGESSTPDDARLKELLHRISSLQQQQEQLAAELADVQQELKGHGGSTNAEQSAEDAAVDISQVPEGLVRRELERLLGLRESAYENNDDPLLNGPPIHEAEELAQLIIDGESLPPPPPGMYAQEPEQAEQFLARLEKSVKRLEDRLTGKKGRKHQQQQQQGKVAEEDQEEDEPLWEGPFSDINIFPQELTDSIPPPDIPPEAKAAMQRAERVAYILRQAYKNSKKPTAALDSLLERQLVAEFIEMEDPWVALQGPQAARSYLEQLERAGVEVQLDAIFANFYEYRPAVRCRIIVDTFIHLPIPSWYLSYLSLNPPTTLLKEEATDPLAPRPIPGNPVEVAVDAYKHPSSVALFPRSEATQSKVEENGTAHAEWMHRGSNSISASRQVLVRNSLCELKKEGEVEDAFKVKAESLDDGVRVLGLAHAEKHRMRSTPLPRIKGFSKLPISTILDDALWEYHPAPEPPAPPPLPRARPADLTRHPLTPAEAEQLLQSLLGDKFKAVAAQLPEPAPKFPPHPAGEGWVQGHTMSIAVSWQYEVDTESGQVAEVTAEWGWVGGPFPDPMDAYDVFVTSCDLMEWQAPGEIDD